ncbi:MAG: flagellar filament capping protein FliD, partial [Planctomycetes bacterium]|nr:flagellar filament capping protein FliD [Planctomycetota bacterium]
GIQQGTSISKLQTSNLTNLAVSASPTTTINISANLDASAAVGATFDTDLTITDSLGGITGIDFSGADAGIATIGQLINTINARSGTGANVTASINSAGTGILLTDDANGTGKLTVKDVNSSTASDLRIEGEAINGQINGSGLFSAQSVNQGVLDKLADRINDLDAGVTAATVFDGVGFRLSLTVDQTGTGNELLLDPGTSVLAFEQVASAQDALVVFGEQSIPGSGVLISSRTNDINQLVSGVNMTIVAPSTTPVTVTVNSTDAPFVDAVEDFVDSYNALRDDLDELTDFDQDNLTVGLLFGSNEALRVDTELSRLVTDRFLGLGNFETLAEIGVTVDDKGKLQLDKSELQQAFADNPSGLQTFFGDKTNGVVAKFNKVIDRLADADNSLLTNRNDALQATIDSNNKRIERFNESLDRQRERMLLQFYQLEQVIATLQQGLSALQTLRPLEPLSIQRDR